MSATSDRPALSVVVPARQAAATLATTLASLRRQTLSDIEIIVVDDGSTDDTRAVALAAAEADPRVRLHSQPNRGVSAARNTGIRLARADLVGFCDADDVWAPGKAAAHLAHMIDRPDVGVSYSGTVTIDDDGQPLGQVRRPSASPVTVADVLCGNPLGNGSTPVISRACLDDVAFPGPPSSGRRTCWFDESYSRSEDAELWCRIAQTRWKIVGLSAPLTGYRQRMRATSLSSDVGATIETWRRMAASLPTALADASASGLAFQWRWQARKAVFAGDGEAATKAMLRALSLAPLAMLKDFRKSAETVAAAAVLTLGGGPARRAMARRLRGATMDVDTAWTMAYATAPTGGVIFTAGTPSAPSESTSSLPRPV